MITRQSARNADHYRFILAAVHILKHSGCSPEYSVSLQSAAAVLQNMDSSKYEAVFEVTINYIEGEDVTPEFNDDFVKENLTASYGWESADDVRDSIREDLRQSHSWLSGSLLRNRR